MSNWLRTGVDTGVAHAAATAQRAAQPATDPTHTAAPRLGLWRRILRERKRISRQLRGLLRRDRNEPLQTVVQAVVQTALAPLRASLASQTRETQSLKALLAAMQAQLGRIENHSLASVRRVAVPCGTDSLLVRTAAGYALCGTHDAALLASLLEAGELEPGTRQLIERFVQPGDCVVDVGANIGLHTLTAARALCGQGRVIAFEPYGPTRQLLERSVWLNGFQPLVQIHEAAVSNVSGQHTLYLGQTSGHHSLWPLDGGAGSVEVALRRLDDAIAHDQRVDLLKIDAEGAELQVLESAAALIARNPDIALIVEFGPSHLHRSGTDPRQWLATFAAHGLEYRVINDRTGALENHAIEQLLACESANLLFSRPASAAWQRLSP